MPMTRKMLLLCIILMITLTGCWDRVDIEKYAFILGIGVDEGEKDGISATYQIALPDAIMGARQGGGDGASTVNITIDAKNLKDADQKLLSRINQIPNYSHLQVVVFGEGLSKKGIRKHLDFFLREPEMRHLTKVTICRGEAEKIFKIQPKNVDSTSHYISEMLNQTQRLSMAIPKYIDLGMLQRVLVHPSDFLLTEVSADKDILNIEGGAVVKGDKLEGWLNANEAMGFKWLKNEVRWGVLELDLDEDKKDRVSFQVIGSQTKIKPIMKSERKMFEFKIKLNVEGDVVETRVDMFKAYNDEFIRRIEKSAEKKISQLCTGVFEKLQKEYEADSLGLCEIVANHYPSFWEKNKRQWKDYFARSEIKVNVKVRVRRVGLIK